MPLSVQQEVDGLAKAAHEELVSKAGMSKSWIRTKRERKSCCVSISLQSIINLNSSQSRIVVNTESRVRLGLQMVVEKPEPTSDL
jgi:hypothetical protein